MQITNKSKKFKTNKKLNHETLSIKKEGRIREEKKKYTLSHEWTKKKKARKMLPCVAVHLGEAVQTVRSGENKRAENFFS